MADVFSINGAGLSTLHARRANVTLYNQGRSQFSITIPRKYDAGAMWALGADLTVTASGAGTIFKGKVTKAPATGVSDARESHTYEAEGPWYDLERCPYEQLWSSVDPDTQTLTRVPIPEVTLGMDDDGVFVRTGATITSILQHAIDKGANLSIGSIPAGIFAPMTDAIDVTCAQAIRMMLRYHPDWVVYWGGTGTSIRMTPASSLSAITINPTDKKVVSVEAQERPDLTPKSVKVNWKTTSKIDDIERVFWAHETAGTTGALPYTNHTFPLRGVEITTQEQKIVTRALPEKDGAGWDLAAARAKKWVKGNFPWLAGESDDDIAINNFSLEWAETFEDEDLTGPGDTANPNAKPLKADPVEKDVENFPRQLLSGTVQPWMRVEAYPARVKCRIFYKGDDPQVIRRFRKIGAIADGTPYWMLEVDDEIPITDAVTKTYSNVDSYDAGELPLEGLASSIFSALDLVKIEGTATVKAKGPFLDAVPGQRIRISHMMGESSVIQSTAFDLVGERMTIRFGVPPHLSAAEIYEVQDLAKVNRSKWGSGTARTEAEADTGTQSISGLKLAGKNSLQPSEPFESGPEWELIDCTDWDEESPVAKVRLAKGSTLSFHRRGGTEIDIADRDEVLTVEASDWIYLEAEGALGEEPTVTLKKGGDWTGFPEVAFFDEDDVMERWVLPLWKIVLDSDTEFAGVPGMPLPGLKAIRFGPRDHLVMFAETYEDEAETLYAIDYPVPGGRAVPAGA